MAESIVALTERLETMAQSLKRQQGVHAEVLEKGRATGAGQRDPHYLSFPNDVGLDGRIYVHHLELLTTFAKFSRSEQRLFFETVAKIIDGDNLAYFDVEIPWNMERDRTIRFIIYRDGDFTYRGFLVKLL